MDHTKTYDVNGHGFDSFTEACHFAKARRAAVIETASGIRRWEPACERIAKRGKRHVLVDADGTVREFSKVRQ